MREELSQLRADLDSPVASVILTLVAGLATFQTFGEALIAPGIVAAVHLFETNFDAGDPRQAADPRPLSRRRGAAARHVWLWGISGALLAVPILLFTVAAWRAYVLREPPKAAEKATDGAKAQAVELRPQSRPRAPRSGPLPERRRDWLQLRGGSPEVREDFSEIRGTRRGRSALYGSTELKRGTESL